MNCSLRAPITFSMEVEPLVDTLPERVVSAGASVWALLSVLVSAGVSVLEPPQPVRAARLKASVRINASVFFMLFFLFYFCYSGFIPRYRFQCTCSV